MRKRYYKFDYYITAKMLGTSWDQSKDFSEQERYDAYRICLDRMGKNRIAATMTIQKWFGLGKVTRPNRERLIQLGFALGFTDTEVREMLVKGALEPDFQVNDYREMIFLYGLQNKMCYEECLTMIGKFEIQLSDQLVLEQHNRTEEIWREYTGSCHLSQEDFLAWMLERAEIFKGYSKTVLDYFKDIKREILFEVKEDAERQLERLLSETGFLRWEEKWHMSKKNRSRNVPKYLHSALVNKTQRISEDLVETIEELLQMTRLSADSNSELLAELYTNIQQQLRKANTRRRRSEIRLMDDKYLSDLLNVGAQKERLMKLVIREIQSHEENDQREALIREQKRRCRLLDRQDILPLILCVAQKRYLRKYSNEKYDAGRAKKQFVDLANQILVSCQMVTLDEERYELDALLCSCFEEEEMCSLSDVLEKYFNQERAQ